MEPNQPKTYLSQSEGKWRVIDQGMPVCTDKETAKECLLVVQQFHLNLSDLYWNGDLGQFLPLWPI